MRFITQPKALAVVMGMVISQSVFATSAIEQKLKEILPGSQNAKIEQSVIPDLYQISVGTKVLYMTADAKYVVSGNIIDIDTRQNLTEKATMDLRKEALAKLDEKGMIVYPAQGKAKRTLTIFSDIDCPYCKKLHHEIPELNQAGIEVRYMAYPRAGVGSVSYHKAVATWCADNPQKALDNAMLNGQVATKECKANPVQEHMKQAHLFGVNGTPNIVLDNGQMIPGYMPAKELIAAVLSNR